MSLVCSLQRLLSSEALDVLGPHSGPAGHGVHAFIPTRTSLANRVYSQPASTGNRCTFKGKLELGTGRTREPRGTRRGSEPPNGSHSDRPWLFDARQTTTAAPSNGTTGNTSVDQIPLGKRTRVSAQGQPSFGPVGFAVRELSENVSQRATTGPMGSMADRCIPAAYVGTAWLSLALESPS